MSGPPVTSQGHVSTGRRQQPGGGAASWTLPPNEASVLTSFPNQDRTDLGQSAHGHEDWNMIVYPQGSDRSWAGGALRVTKAGCLALSPCLWAVCKGSQPRGWGWYPGAAGISADVAAGFLEPGKEATHGCLCLCGLSAVGTSCRWRAVSSQAWWWCTPVISALGRLGCEMVNLISAWAS